MAYYNDNIYDSSYYTPFADRRQDSYPRFQDPNHPLNTESTAGRSSRGRGSSHQTGGEYVHGRQGDRSTTSATYDLRASFPPPPPPDTGRPQRPRPSPSRRRQAWPPQPTCEDERVSLAKEANGWKLWQDIRDNEVPSRGTIDQDPVLQEVPELINKDERRFVVVPESQKASKSSGVLTPPTSEDERARRVKRRPSRLDTDVRPHVPEVARRTASPYSFTKPTKLPQAASSSERFLSPDALTPPPSELGRRQNRVDSRSKPSSPRGDARQNSPSIRKGSDYFTTSNSRDGQAIADEDWAQQLPDSRRSSARSATNGALPGSSPRSSTQDFAPQPSTTLPMRRARLDARRNTDTPDTLPRLDVEKSRRPPPPVASTTLDPTMFAASSNVKASADFYAPRTREGSYISSRAISPASAVSRVSPSPPRSPRVSADYSAYLLTAERSPGSRPGSRPGSASGSGSRPSSPAPPTPGDSPRVPRVDVDWSVLLNANASRRTKPPSRLAASMRQESLPDVHHTSASFSSASRPYDGLPYPEDDGPGGPSAYMPVESRYQFFLNPSSYEAESQFRDGPPVLANVSRRSDRPSRPSLPTRHSIATVSPTEERPRPPAPRTNSFVTSSQTRRELALLEKKGLPDCPRAALAAGHDEWYTVIGAPDLDFCPDCVSNVFERTVFMPGIRRSPPRSFSTKVQCALGSSEWIRLAWLLTLQQQRTDFTLLRDVAEVERSFEPCPGRHEEVRTWYGLKDSEGFFVRKFHICISDVRKIERLLPTLSGVFVPWPPRASYDERQCAVHAEGNCFSAYLNAMITTHKQAMTNGKAPDPTPLIKTIKHKTQLRQCKRDKMFIGELWHFIPSLQALTVCEDCYEAIVEPKIQEGSEVAKRFNRSLQPVYGEGVGSSCQLYSPHMRSVFERAVRDNDFRYLVRKAEERREAELRLLEKYEDLKRRAKRISRDGDGSGSESELRKLDLIRKRITTEWRDDWE